MGDDCGELTPSTSPLIGQPESRDIDVRVLLDLRGNIVKAVAKSFDRFRVVPQILSPEWLNVVRLVRLGGVGSRLLDFVHKSVFSGVSARSGSIQQESI